MHEAFYSVDGLRLRYLEWGNRQAEPIVVVHGFSSTADAWANVGEVLAADYHVIAPDLRGHGESAWDPRERYADEQLAADVRVLVQQLALPPFTLIGHSMGGAVAFTYAATYPEDVMRLVIEDSAPLPPNYVMAERRTSSSPGMRLCRPCARQTRRCQRQQCRGVLTSTIGPNRMAAGVSVRMSLGCGVVAARTMPNVHGIACARYECRHW